MKKLFFGMIYTFVLIFIGLILYNPKICTNSIISALVLCGRVIIPSLYPFTFCVLFMVNSNMLNCLKFKGKILGLDSKTLPIFLLSLIGGYPLGAKLLSSSKIEKNNASVMLNYCVNAGPAFIILAIGDGIFGSKKIGVLLFCSHTLASITLAFLFRKKLTYTSFSKTQTEVNIIDAFVISANEAAKALISICGYVILFSAICAYINAFPFLKPLSLILEITNAINHTKNIYLISGLLGFSGICVWCQAFSLSKNTKPNYPLFVLSRVLHGVSSSFFTFLLLKIFGIALPVLSNGKSFDSSLFFQNGSVGILLILTGLVLIISLSSKNFAGNMLEDMI